MIIKGLGEMKIIYLYKWLYVGPQLLSNREMVTNSASYIHWSVCMYWRE